MNLQEIQNQIERIKILEQEYKQHLKELNINVDNNLYYLALDSKNEETKFLAQAMLHEKYGIKPTIQELGYILAKIDVDKLLSDPLPKQIYKRFDLGNYIFSTTHYDSYGNGRYYRMS